MSKTKNAPAAVPAATEAELQSFIYSDDYNNTAQYESQELLNLLGRGRGNALTAPVLANALDCTPRVITRTIQSLRRQGYPICAETDAQGGGYFLATDSDELAAYIKRLRRRLHNTLLTAEALNATLNNLNVTGRRQRGE